MKFSFICHKCGAHTVNETTFRSFVTPAMQERLNTAIRGGKVSEVRLRFSVGCPTCTPEGKCTATLSVLKAKNPQ